MFFETIFSLNLSPIASITVSKGVTGSNGTVVRFDAQGGLYGAFELQKWR